MHYNDYLLILGVKVSGYIQYTGVKIINGLSLDNAYNNEFLDNPMGKDVVVMEAYKMGIAVYGEPKMRRII